MKNNYEKVMEAIKCLLEKEQDFVLGETEDNPDEISSMDNPVVYSMGVCHGLQMALSIIEENMV